jgi:alpha-L-fucosidase 2
MRNRKYQMTSRQPATRWEDAFPTGNGSVGALVYGNLRTETIVLNHENLWLRADRPVLPDVSCHLPELRRLLAEGRWQEAQDFLPARLDEAGYDYLTTDSYHPAGDLRLEMDTQQAFEGYERRADFTTGEITVAWREGEAGFQRRLFVSRADEVVVLSVRCTEPGRVAVTISLRPHPGAECVPVTFESGAEGGWLALLGRYQRGGEFGLVGRVVATGGQMGTTQGAVRVTGADEALVLVKLYANEPSAEALPRLRAELEALPADYAALRRRHARLHRELFLRARLDLHAGAQRRRSNEELLAAAYNGEPTPALLERLFDYGRYLLICSSRPGGLPANLQGVWNGEWAPAWSSDYHNDENIQMNYWPALPGGLPEMVLPFFDYYESCLDDFRENARRLLGCSGILAPIAQTTHGLLYPGVWVNWTAGAGWLGQLFYDYWLFTGDREFLAQRAVPFLREVALFYEDFLVEGPDGRLLFSPSLSPENVPDIPGGSLVSLNATMDVAVAREVLGNLYAGCEVLGLETENLPRWRSLRERLPEYAVNEDGALREWLYPGLKDNYHHRHESHLYPLFPGLEITEESDPGLFQAMRVAVEKRLVIGLVSQTGWSFAHMANVRARLGEGDRALECLELLTRSCVGPNLFTYHNDWRAMGLTVDWFTPTGMTTDFYTGPPMFQIDANLGVPAAMLEMLVFSQPGLVKLLPALPARWLRGHAEGLRCRGGVAVSLAWDLEAGEVEASLLSATAQTVRVKLPPGFTRLEGDFAGPQPGYAEVVLSAGVPVQLIIRP